MPVTTDRRSKLREPHMYVTIYRGHRAEPSTHLAMQFTAS